VLKSNNVKTKNKFFLMRVFMRANLPVALGSLLLGLLTLNPVAAQENLPRAAALSYAFAVAADLGEMLKTPIPTDPDLKRPVAAREGDYGGMVLPESKLTAGSLEKAGKDLIPVGQLWLLKLVPMSDGRPLPGNRLRFVDVTTEEGHAKVPCCVLAVRTGEGDALELALLGNDKTPLLTAPLKKISKPQDNPIDLAAERKEDGGLLSLKILGKYEASFMVTDPDEF
jgi:hypothetical protein